MAASPASATNLPAQLSSFIGREAELVAVRRLVAGSRLVTLTGAGGVGKTRLALRVAAGLADGAGDGVWFADLAPLQDPDLVWVTVADVLGVRLRPDRPVAETVVQAVGGRRLLLVLDNCEHLIGTCAKLADALLRGCPNVALLATSREPLGIGGEQVYRVPSLGVPADGDDAEAIGASEAVRLLVDRAAAQGVPLGWDERAVQLAGRICRRLDGIPLAIELAAARLRVMSADELEGRLDDRFALLTGGSRAGLARQQTLRAMVDWSWELLNPAERAVLARLSVFAGGFGLAAAEAVAAGPDVPAGEVPGQLGALVDKSLVQFGDTGVGPGRYRLLETVRQYAAVQLDAIGRPAAETARLAHCDYYLALAEEAAPHLVAADQVAWLNRLDAELGNLRAAVVFSLTRADPVPGLRLATSLRAYWRIRGHAAEGADVLQALLAIPAAQPTELLRARALTDAAHLIMHTGDYAIAEEYCQEALAIARAAGDERLVAEVLSQYATVLLPQGKADAALPLIESGLSLARPLAEPHLTARLLGARAFATSVAGDREAAARDAAEALRLFRQAGDQIQTAQMLDNIGYDELSAGDLDAARRHLAEALNITRALNDRNGIVYQTLNLGLAEYLGGSRDAAGALFGESFDLASRAGMRSQVGYALVGLALAGHGVADPGWSARLHGAADQALADQGSVLEPLEAGLADLDRERLRAAMGAEAFETEYTQGRTLDPAQVLAALGRTGTTAGPAPAAASDEPVTGSGAGGVVVRQGLLRRLGGPARVAVVSAPPGSGKTVLLRSWMSQPALSGRTAWVAAGPDNQDPQRFWRSVLGALSRTGQGPALVQGLTAAPDRDGWVVAERLLTELAPLADPIWLVIDDLHELGPDALRQLELLVMRAPPGLRFVLAAQHEVLSGLHQLRLEGELAEIRGPDLRFTVAEAAELFAAAGVELPDPALALLVERTEGWAAGLRLAALSLAGNPDPERFAWEFSGTERTVAEYLLAEVLDRQPGPVRRLLLRTSVLERVNGELADLLTGDAGGERVLQDLADANALVVPLDAARSWFRYHQMLADLLALELRRTAPGEIAGLHRAAAGWFAEHEHPVEAVGQAQAAQDWGLAARLLSDFWPGLYLDGQSAAARELLAAFPAEASADAELAAVTAGDELARGSLGAAERYLGLAERGSGSVPDGRRAQLDVLLAIVRMLLARLLGNPQAVAEQTRRLQAPESAQHDAAPAVRAGLGEELRALALISLGSAEAWTARAEDAERHLEQGVALARHVRRPYLEFSGLAYLAAAETGRSFARAAERSRQAIELAGRHGWTDEPALGVAYLALGSTLTWQGWLEEAEPWVQRAERTVGADADPGAATEIHNVRGILELARGRAADALAAFRTAERLARRLAPAHLLVPQARAMLVQALVRLGETERAEQILDGLGEHDRADGQTRIATAVLRLAQHDPRAAGVALTPLLDGSTPVLPRVWQAHAFLLEAIIRDALGDPAASGRALEGALDLAEPDGAIWAFLLHPVPGLLERHAGHGTAHAALIAEILSLLAGRTPAGREPPLEPVSDSEMRVLRYLPTNLTAPEIARELYVARNTVKTHMRSLYAKLGTHSRADTVARARALGLLAPSALKGQARPAG
jgi:LuxR family maltose regulon positive regulatory protein